MMQYINRECRYKSQHVVLLDAFSPHSLLIDVYSMADDKYSLFNSSVRATGKFAAVTLLPALPRCPISAQVVFVLDDFHSHIHGRLPNW